MLLEVHALDEYKRPSGALMGLLRVAIAASSLCQDEITRKCALGTVLLEEAKELTLNPFRAAIGWSRLGCAASSRSSGSKLINISHIC